VDAIRVPLDSIEIWEIENATPLAHPFHIHNMQFRVLDRDGEPPLPHERGLEDTVLVDPGSAVRVIAEFSDFGQGAPLHVPLSHPRARGCQEDGTVRGCVTGSLQTGA
jgi:FtsP/CotA-like multicopper oxidase with cupredoxin domain